MAEPVRRRRPRLILLIVPLLLVVGLFLAIPDHITRARLSDREAALKEDLSTFRQCLQQYKADKSHYPAALNDLVSERYIRKIPVDPFTRSASTWQVEQDASGHVTDVHSGSQAVSTLGSRYSEW